MSFISTADMPMGLTPKPDFEPRNNCTSLIKMAFFKSHACAMSI
jgi:hypothetical protein